MDDEYVRVTFPARCPVLVDDVPTGYTNVVFQVQTGTHIFGLDTPRDYTPKRQEVLVEETLPGEPLVIAFQPVAADPGKG
jgi:hypothetical protein